MSDARVSEVRENFSKAIRAIWWLTLLRGILLIILGLYALANPGMTIIILAKVIGFYLILEGVLAVWAGVTGQTESRFWTMVRGALLVLAGLIALAYPIGTSIFLATVLVCMTAIAFIASGIAEVYFAIRERKQIEGEGWLILGGVLEVILGLMLVAAPLAGAKAIVWLMGLYAVIGGIALIFAAFRFRSFGQKLKS